MKTFGNKTIQELISLNEKDGSYDVNQLCPRGKHWEEDPDAPWNEEDHSLDSADYPDLLWIAPEPVIPEPILNEAGEEIEQEPIIVACPAGKLEQDNPGASWNLPNPSHNSSDYPDLLWVAPEIIPFPFICCSISIPSWKYLLRMSFATRSVISFFSVFTN